MLLLPDDDNDDAHYGCIAVAAAAAAIAAIIAHHNISSGVYASLLAYFGYTDFFSSTLLFAHVILLTSHTHTVRAAGGRWSRNVGFVAVRQRFIARTNGANCRSFSAGSRTSRNGSLLRL